MKAEIWNPGQPAKKEDLDAAQVHTQEAIRERLLDTFSPGVLPGSQLGGETQTFYITPDTGLSVQVGSGVAVGANAVVPMTAIDGMDLTNTGGERIYISVADTAGISANNYSNSINGGPGTGTGTGTYKESSNGLGGWTATPQNTGTRNIPLVNGVVNYVWLSYLRVVDMPTTSLHKVTSAILYPRALDGYQIVINQINSAPAADPRWIRIGSVDLTTSPGSVVQSMITSASVSALTLPNRVAFAYNPALYAPSVAPTPGTTLSLETFLNARGTGTVTINNILGLSLADMGFTEDVNLIQHEHYHHSSGLVVPNIASTTSALYPQIQAGGPVLGITYSVGMKQLSSAGSFPEELAVGGLVAVAGVGSPSVAPAAPIAVAPAISIGDPFVGFTAADPVGTYSVYAYLLGTQPAVSKAISFSNSADTFLVCTVAWDGAVLSSLVDKRLFGTVGSTNIQATGVTPGVYGNPLQVAEISIGPDGRIGSAASVTISGTPPGGLAGGDLFGTYPSPVVNLVGGSPAANVHNAELLANGATPANSPNAIVRRNGGDFAAGTITATLAGNAASATNISGGVASEIPYQTGAGATAFIPNGSSGQVLTSAGASVPTWQNPLSKTRYYAAKTVFDSTTPQNFVVGTASFTPALPVGTTILPVVEVFIVGIVYSNPDGQSETIQITSSPGTPFTGSNPSKGVFFNLAMTDAIRLTSGAAGTQGLNSDYMIVVTI